MLIELLLSLAIAGHTADHGHDRGINDSLRQTPHHPHHPDPSPPNNPVCPTPDQQPHHPHQPHNPQPYQPHTPYPYVQPYVQPYPYQPQPYRQPYSPPRPYSPPVASQRVMVFGRSDSTACQRDKAKIDSLRRRGISVEYIDTEKNPKAKKAWAITAVPTYVLIENGQPTLRTYNIKKLTNELNVPRQKYPRL